MFKQLIMAGSAILALIVCAEEIVQQKAEQSVSAKKELTPAEKAANIKRFKQRYYENTGGRVVNPNSGKGKIVFVNTQSLVSTGVLSAMIDELALSFSLRMAIHDGEKPTLENIDEAAKSSGGATTVFIVDDPVLPISVVAYEAGWAIVNVGKLAKAGDGIVNARIQKELARSFAMTSGISYGTGTAGLMAPVRKAADLDSCVLPERVNPNLYTHIHNYLSIFGVTPTQVATYRKACKDGWAAAPTNDVQKAIWDKEMEKKSQKPAK